MEKKPKYNDSNIKDAVNSLHDCIAKISEDLSSKKYQELFDSLEGTVSALNRIDDLMPFKSQIQSEIIDPVEKHLKESLKINFRFGYIGIIFAAVGIAFTIFSSFYFSFSTSNRIHNLISQLDTTETIGGFIKSENKKIFTRLKENTDILTALQSKIETECYLAPFPQIQLYDTLKTPPSLSFKPNGTLDIDSLLKTEQPGIPRQPLEFEKLKLDK